MKKTLVLLGLALTVTLGFCGCGPSEEEVYEILARVEQKQKKIKEANLSMDQGFQEKWDLLERQFTSANRAFSKGDYSATAKFLQDAEAAADWIMSRGPLRYEADEKYSELQSRKRYSNSNEINAPKYASTIYAEAEEYEQQGQEAYEKIEFEEATRLYVLAANEYKKATSTASTFHAAVQVTNVAKEKADKENASRWSSTIYQEALSYSQQAVDANAQGKYDEALQLLDAAEGTFEKAEKEVFRNALPHLIKSFVKIEERDYYIGKYEVTQVQWRAVMGNNPAYFKGTTDRPVEQISWHGAMEFCKKLNDMGLAPAGYKFSLPTEAQWEYAARGGNKSKGYEYSGSNDINEVAWYDDNSGRQTHPVGEKKPNELGLYDMSGNVWEWCLDTYYGSGRIVRGGDWDDLARYCRVAYRDDGSAVIRGRTDGFRLALVPVQ